MSEKRFIVETVEITDCDTDVSRIAKVITDKEEIYSYDDLYEIVDLLNEQQSTIESLEKEKVELMEDCACQYRRIQKLESEKEELEISIKLFEDDVSRLTEENEQLKKEVENLQSNMMESLGKHRKYEKSLEEENKRKTNEIKLLRKQYSKIPPKIREVWLK